MDYESENKLKLRNKIKEISAELPEFTKEFITYCSSTKNYSMRTILNYVTDLRVFFRYLAASNPMLHGDIRNITLDFIDQLNPQDLQEYLSEIEIYEQDGVAHANGECGKARKIASLRSFYKYYYSMGLIKNNPSSIISSPKMHKKNVIHMERSESDDLIRGMENLSGLTERQASFSNKSHYRDLAIVTLLLGTGIRVSECVGINLKDINWKTRSIRILRKGGNESTVYFNEDVEARLNDYIELERKAPENDPDALFVSRNQTRTTVRSVERMVKKYTQASVPQKHITPHKMRSTYGTNLYQETNDIYLVADALGHSSLNVVQRYADIGDERRKLASEVTDWTHKEEDEEE